MDRGDKVLHREVEHAIAIQADRLMSILFGTSERLDGLMLGVRQDADAKRIRLREDIGWDNLKELALRAFSREIVVSLADVAEELAQYLERAGYVAIADEIREKIKGAVN